MRFHTLPEWLDWQEHLHFTDIDPGLDRLGRVWHVMYPNLKLPFKVVTIAGTNGKGSSVAMLSSIMQQAGYKTATYTSPHLLEYNERICIDRVPVADDKICRAFQQIDDSRGEISLTYFEFATLAAIHIFIEEKVDIAVLEVGMGGRLDAVNLFDADIALITPIGLDHTQWLGDTREKIGLEKAGILRTAHPVVISDENVPVTVINKANELQTPVYLAQSDYRYQLNENSWIFETEKDRFNKLDFPNLAGRYQVQNAAAVIQVCLLLRDLGLNISEHAISSGLQNIKLSGRFQIIPGEVTRILDVTHNAQGAKNLAELLRDNTHGRVLAVMAMLKDKDVKAVAEILSTIIDEWFVAGLDGNRAQSGDELAMQLTGIISETAIKSFAQVETAYKEAMHSANAGDTVIVFGSFHTVEAVMRLAPELRQ